MNQVVLLRASYWQPQLGAQLAPLLAKFTLDYMKTVTTLAMYKIRPIRPEFLENVRNLGVDDLGQPVERHIATGGEPCRDVLRGALAGEEIILASYCPFALSGPYKEYGPVFVLAEARDTMANLSILPTQGSDAYFNKAFVLRAYSKDERIVDAVLTSTEEAEDHLFQLLANETVDFVLARFAGYGCYGCRIERGDAHRKPSTVRTLAAREPHISNGNRLTHQ